MAFMRKTATFYLVALLSFPISLSAQWVRTNGPFGGAANALTSNGSEIFACIDGSIYLSTDHGSTWNSIGPANLGVNSIASGNGNLFALTGGGGILLSTDGGAAWNTINNGLPYLNVRALSVIGNNLLVSIQSGDVMSPSYSVYRSTNNGTSWTSANNGLPNASVNTFVTNTVGTQDTSIFAGTRSGIFLSANDGESWTSIGLSNIGVSALAVISNNTNVTNIIAGSNNGIYQSTNGGEKWEHTNSGLLDTLVSAIAISPNSPGGINIFAGTRGGSVYLSTDNGTSWNNMSTGLMAGSWDWGASIHSLTFVGTNLFACTNAGVFLSTNNGTNWKPANNGVSRVAVHAIAVDSNAAGTTNIFAGTFPSGVFLSTNNGSDWTAVNNGINSIDINALAISGKNIFAGGATGAYLSTNNGASWNNIGLVNSGEVVALLSASDGAGDTVILAGTWNGAYISTDNGGRWDSTRLAGDVQALAVSPRDSGGMNIFEGTRGSGIFLSTDKGGSWKSENTGLPLFSDIIALSFSGSDLFAAGDLLYLSSDNGASWNPTTLPTTSNTWICCLAISPSGGGNADIFVGTNDEGVLVSTNNGVTWHSANSGLTDMCVYSLAISGSYLFAGTNLSSVWKRQLSELTSVQGTPPSQIPNQYSLSQNFPNPFNPSTVISYQLPVSTFVTLKVYDELGRLVRTLVNEIQTAGIHSIPFNASNLSSGAYFYRLSARNFVNTKKIDVNQIKQLRRNQRLPARKRGARELTEPAVDDFAARCGTISETATSRARIFYMELAARRRS